MVLRWAVGNNWLYFHGWKVAVVAAAANCSLNSSCRKMTCHARYKSTGVEGGGGGWVSYTAPTR